MAWRYDSWESYFYPETINPVTGDGTLRNLYDEHDPRVLARFEYIETTGRATELLRGDVTIEIGRTPRSGGAVGRAREVAAVILVRARCGSTSRASR